MLLGWSVAQQGDREKGIEFMLEGSKMSHVISNSAGQPYYWCLLADVLADGGEFTEAFHLIEKAEAQINTTGERRLEAEHYRIKGEIILKRNPADKPAARASFEQAIQVARQQGAIFFEQKAQACLNQMNLLQA
jgi:predicted ATPase